MRKQSLKRKTFWLGGILALLVLFTGTQVLASPFTPPSPAAPAGRFAILSDADSQATAISGYAIKSAVDGVCSGAGEVERGGLCFMSDDDNRPVPASLPAAGVEANASHLNPIFPRPVSCLTGLPGGSDCSAFDTAVVASGNVSHVQGTISSDRRYDFLFIAGGVNNADWENNLCAGLQSNNNGLRVCDSRSYRLNASSVTLYTIVAEKSSARISTIGIEPSGKSDEIFTTILGPGAEPIAGAVANDVCMNFGGAGSALIPINSTGTPDLENTIFFNESDCGGQGTTGTVSTSATSCTSGIGGNQPCINQEEESSSSISALSLSATGFSAAAVTCDAVKGDVFTMTLVFNNIQTTACIDGFLGTNECQTPTCW